MSRPLLLLVAALAAVANADYTLKFSFTSVRSTGSNNPKEEASLSEIVVLDAAGHALAIAMAEDGRATRVEDAPARPPSQPGSLALGPAASPAWGCALRRWRPIALGLVPLGEAAALLRR